MKHPFATGLAVGTLGLLAWYKRGWIVALFRRLRHPLSDSGVALPPADPGIAVRQIRRYTFASMQDRSPVVGLTHASYALILLDTLEEMVGRDAIKGAGFDPGSVRKLITGMQDKHAEALRSCDPFLAQTLAVEQGEKGGALPGVVAA